jgi:ferredoxin
MHQEMTRRGFLEAGAATVAAGKLVDGGFAPVSNPGKPERSTAIVPAGAKSLRAFRAKCVGCQLCVRVCPEKVLRPSRNSKRFLLPEMGFEHGYCRPSCTRCAEVCPAGAIEKITREEKLHTHIGRAAWHKDRCIAAKSKVRCNVCERHCPVKAIVLINNIPVVDAAKCIGCGACENLCPSRPMPAITVDGCEVHRCDVPVTANEVAYELSHPGESKIQEQV